MELYFTIALFSVMAVCMTFGICYLIKGMFSLSDQVVKILSILKSKDKNIEKITLGLVFFNNLYSASRVYSDLSAKYAFTSEESLALESALQTYAAILKEMLMRFSIFSGLSILLPVFMMVMERILF